MITPDATNSAHGPSTDRVASLFPGEIAGQSYRRRRRIRRAATAAVVVVLLAGGGLALAQTTGGTPNRYRLATAGQHEVAATLDGVATIQPVAQASVAFPDAGTVASVAVAVGDTVTAGQALAQLDTDDLMVTVRSKEAALDKAQLVLAEAIAGKDVSALLGGSVGRSFVLAPASMVQMLDALVTAAPDGLSTARQAVAGAQHDVDTAVADAASALTAATSVCAAIGVDADTTDPASISTAVSACQAALNTVVTKQAKVQTAQGDLADASAALDALLQQWADDIDSSTTEPTTTAPTAPTTAPTTPTTEPTTATTTPSSTTTEPTTATTGPANGSVPAGDDATGSSEPVAASGGRRSGAGVSAAGGSGGSRSVGGGGTATSTPTASDIAAYQQAVDAAQSDLDVATLAVAQATISSPIDGQVIAVGVAAGDSVSAGSTTETIVIQGTGGYEATTTVSLTHVADVHVGATATVLPDGATQTYSGTVVSVAQVPATSDSGVSSFGVAIALDGDTSALHNGGIGSVSIVTGTSAATLAVPTSAVTTSGSLHTVEVYDGSTVTTTRVEVGVVGSVWTQIASGLTDGQTVVVAELDKALPSSATSSSNGTTTARTFTINGRTITVGGGRNP